MWEYAAAIREPFFWKVIATDGAAIFYVTGVNVHFLDVFAGRGLSKPEVATLSIFLSAGLFVGQIAVGSQLDKLSLRRKMRLLVAMYGLIACSQLLLLRTPGRVGSVDTLAAASVWYLLFGIGLGGIIIFRSVIVPDVFGRKALGRLNSIFQGVNTMMSGLGPLVMGALRQWSGSYELPVGLSLLIMLPLIGTIATAEVPTAPNPRARPRAIGRAIRDGGSG